MKTKKMLDSEKMLDSDLIVLFLFCIFIFVIMVSLYIVEKNIQRSDNYFPPLTEITRENK